jgi:hypothetical protein
VSVPRPYITHRIWPIIVALELFLIGGLLTIGVVVLAQRKTEHQVCQAFQFVGDRTQQQINLTSRKLILDMQRHDKKNAAIDRKSIGDATSFLIRVRAVNC